MSVSIPIPANTAELLRDPRRVRDALELLNALASLEVHLVPPGAAAPLSPGRNQIVGTPPSLVLPLPLQCPSAVADSSATAASVSTQLNLLLAGLRRTGILPTG
jgi:hypothetical protein